LGALSLGLAGCGGGGDEGFPVVSLPTDTISIPASAAPTPQTAIQQVPVPMGQGATVPAAAADIAQNPGVTSLTINVPAGKTTQDTTLAVSIIPSAQSTIVKIQQTSPNAVAGITPITEFAFGPVGADGKIDISRPIVFGSGTATIVITPQEAQQIANLLATPGSVLVVRQINGNGLNVNHEAHVTITKNDSGNTILVVTGLDSGQFTIEIDTPAAHNQGRVG